MLVMAHPHTNPKESVSKAYRKGNEIHTCYVFLSTNVSMVDSRLILQLLKTLEHRQTSYEKEFNGNLS